MMRFERKMNSSLMSLMLRRVAVVLAATVALAAAVPTDAAAVGYYGHRVYGGYHGGYYGHRPYGGYHGGYYGHRLYRGHGGYYGHRLYGGYHGGYGDPYGSYGYGDGYGDYGGYGGGGW
jgi:hypothetical protein